MTQKYTINPAPGYIIVEPVKSEEFNKSGLATVDDGREHVSTGKVLHVSKYAGTYENYTHQVSTNAKVGDIIAYIQYSEHPIRLNGEELHQVRFDKVTSTIKEAE